MFYYWKNCYGHSSISATEVYVHLYNKHVKEAVDKNPLNNYEPVKKAA